jgi:hypothetical protein
MNRNPVPGSLNFWRAKTMSFHQLVRKVLVAALLAITVLVSGCASVPMASKEKDASAKTFAKPAGNSASLYIYRNSNFGAALKKWVSLDGVALYQSAPMTYMYVTVPAGKHVVSTQSEFGDNELELSAEDGRQYFIRNYIKMGVFVGGANLEFVDEATGKAGVQECSLAAPAETTVAEK